MTRKTITDDMIEDVTTQLASHSTEKVYLKCLSKNQKKLDLEFMLEHGRLWVLSHHDRIKMRYDNLQKYLNTV